MEYEPSRAEQAFLAHPWLPNDSSAVLRRELEGPCRLAWQLREFHTRDCSFLRDVALPPGCPAAAEEEIATDKDGWEALRRSLDVFSALATSHATGIAQLIWSGGYLFTLPVLARASIEASIAGCWSLNSGVSHNERIHRAHLIRFNDISRFIGAARDEDTRNEAKRNRKAYREALEKNYDNIEFGDSGDLAQIEETRAPTFAQQFEETSERLGFGQLLRSQYGMLSQMAHPNPATAETMWHRNGQYRWEPTDSRRIIWVVTFAYQQYASHFLAYYGAESTALPKLESAIEAAFPDFFTSDE